MNADAAADGLREQLHSVLWHVWQNPSERPADYATEWTDAVLPVVEAYAAAERERIAARIEAGALGHTGVGDCAYNCPRCVTDSAYLMAARIARAAP